MNIDRLHAKLFFANPVESTTLVPVFHRWIQDKVLPDVQWIDVASYAHVFFGPSVVLIGHQADVRVDSENHAQGLVYAHKRGLSGGLAERLSLVLTKLWRVREQMQQDAPVQIRTDGVELTLADRLLVSNTQETFEKLKTALMEAARSRFDSPSVTRVSVDPRQMLKIELRGR